MMRRERQKDLVYQHNVLEIIDDTLPIQKVHRGPQEVPVQRPRKAQTPVSARDICNGDNFFEGYNLQCGDDSYHIDMSCEHGYEKARNHN